MSLIIGNTTIKEIKVGSTSLTDVVIKDTSVGAETHIWCKPPSFDAYHSSTYNSQDSWWETSIKIHHNSTKTVTYSVIKPDECSGQEITVSPGLYGIASFRSSSKATGSVTWEFEYLGTSTGPVITKLQGTSSL